MAEDRQIIYTQKDIRRPPYWRYDRVRYLLRKSPQSQVFLPDDDTATRYFYVFCQDLNRCDTPEERYALKEKYPGILHALELRKNTPLDVLGLIEGFLLTNADMGFVCEKFSLPPATVAWYEHLFLDVWGRKKAGIWVETEAVKPQFYPAHALTRKDGRLSSIMLLSVEDRQSVERAIAYRKMGFHGGVVVLELFATGFLSSDVKPTYRDLADTFIKKALEMGVSNEGVMMMHAKRKLNKTEGEFIKMALDLSQAALNSGNADIIQNVQKALSSVAPIVGDDVKAYLEDLVEKDPSKELLLNGAAELRHTEITKLHLGLEMSPETRMLVDSYNTRRQEDETVNE